MLIVAVRWIVLALAWLLGLWLMFDGARALMVGDYVTPGSGEHAGQLGPWAHVVRTLGFDPRSSLIKSLHVALGLAWLVSLTLYQFHPAPGGAALLVCAAASLWYVPIGTVISSAVVALLVAARG